MKGLKCRCGFATISQRGVCPRCGKKMRQSEWPDEGRVLSFARLQTIPEGLADPYNLVLVAIEKGPKLICWTSGTLREDDPVTIVELKGKLFCSPKSELTFKLDEPVKA
jgi:uncharacterized OB-fold protein